MRRLAALIVLGATGCAIFRPEPARLPTVGQTEVGIASWYGPGFHGRPTASGERYDQWALTAAHRTLPMGTQVRVTSLENARAVGVRINDRGPFVDGRVIDLSRAAAERLRMIGPGLMRVRVEVLDLPTRAAAPRHLLDDRLLVYVVQLGSYSRRASAEALRDELACRFADAHVTSFNDGRDRSFRVRVGPYETRATALRRAEHVSRLGYDPIVMRTTRP